MDIGYHVHPSVAIDFVPQIKWTNYYAPYWPSTDYEYTNLYLPLIFSIVPLPEKSVAPFLGIGLAVNVQLRYNTIYHWEISDVEALETDFYLVYVLGIDAKLSEYRIRPEIFFNQNMTGNAPDDIDYALSNYDFGLAITLAYAL
jgi:hypothetical protein